MSDEEAGDRRAWFYSNAATLADVRLDIDRRQMRMSVPSLAPSHLARELTEFAVTARRRWRLRGESAIAFLRRWRAARKAAARAAGEDVDVADRAALTRFLAFQKVKGTLEELLARSPLSPRMGDTFLIRRHGERRVFTAATCPKPTWVVMPPVECLVLFQNPNFRFGGARAGIERAPVIPADDWLFALRPWLYEQPSGAGAWRLDEGTVLTEEGPFQAFEAVWNGARQAPRFGEFEILHSASFIDRPLR